MYPRPVLIFALYFLPSCFCFSFLVVVIFVIYGPDRLLHPSQPDTWASYASFAKKYSATFGSAQQCTMFSLNPSKLGNFRMLVPALLMNIFGSVSQFRNWTVSSGLAVLISVSVSFVRTFFLFFYKAFLEHQKMLFLVQLSS